MVSSMHVASFEGVNIVALCSSFMKAKDRIYLHDLQNMQTDLFSCVRHMIIFL
jgi:hypothetical protein